MKGIEILQFQNFTGRGEKSFLRSLFIQFKDIGSKVFQLETRDILYISLNERQI